VEQLPEESLPSAIRFLESLNPEDSSLQRLLRSPEDDEPLTSEERARLSRSAEESRRGEVRSWAEIRDTLS
jgi:ubiquitin-protein ligase